MERYEIYIKRGESMRFSVQFKHDGSVISLSGFSAKSQVRETPDGGKLICEISCTMDLENNKILLTLDPEVTAAIPSGNYAWDLKVMQDEDFARYYIGGKMTVIPSVTE